MPSPKYKTITIRNETHALLKRMATENHRSMASQLLVILEQVKKSLDKQSHDR